MSQRALLDVNVLVALFDPDHVHHDLAHDWFADRRGQGWATCPITENGFVRVLSNPAYGAGMSRPADLVARLRRFCQNGGHEFWPDAVTLRDGSVFRHAHLGSSRQLTEVYLLALARSRGGVLATFDRSIPVSSVSGGESSLELITPSD